MPQRRELRHSARAISFVHTVSASVLATQKSSSRLILLLPSQCVFGAMPRGAVARWLHPALMKVLQAEEKWAKLWWRRAK